MEMSRPLKRIREQLGGEFYGLACIDDGQRPKSAVFPAMEALPNPNNS